MPSMDGTEDEVLWDNDNIEVGLINPRTSIRIPLQKNYAPTNFIITYYVTYHTQINFLYLLSFLNKERLSSGNGSSPSKTKAQ